ncbi:MAG: D-Ala-D-Ala carboxypeptidase family metallohydrolase [Thermoanaerobaculia bacterium]
MIRNAILSLLSAVVVGTSAPNSVPPAPVPPSTGFANLVGFSGKLRSIFLFPEDAARLKDAGALSGEPGIYSLVPAAGLTGRLSVFILEPFSAEVGGRIGSYEMGTWPDPSRAPKDPSYALPRGFIRVDKASDGVAVSEHFKVGEFLTKDQPAVWPKYLVLDARLLDKLELTISQLNAMGYPVKNLFVMSGFRTPRYNGLDLGPKSRSAVSRHMYGDAADVYPDDDHDGKMDDLNHDGKVDEADAQIVFRAAEEVEKRFPVLVGGIAIYRATSAHGPFVHIDCRGKRARWGVGFGE